MVTLCVFLSLSVPVCILEIEHSASGLKWWTKKLKCCERNKQCEKWKRPFFFSGLKLGFVRFTASWMEEMGRHMFLKRRIVRNTSSKFHGEWIYVELFKDLCWNLLDVTSGLFGVSKGKDSRNTAIASGFKNEIDWNLCVRIMLKRGKGRWDFAADTKPPKGTKRSEWHIKKKVGPVNNKSDWPVYLCF